MRPYSRATEGISCQMPAAPAGERKSISRLSATAKYLKSSGRESALRRASM
ncbi:MAG: hypothetical protein RML35_14235 [Chloroherpetonaceae bacterium]|nr:hypothetical protein [Chloroherpetonaceae bacterium]